MADLGFLFNKYEPTGMMGGVQQGMSNAKTLADIGHTSTATDRMAFDTEQARLSAPYDLQVKQLAGMNAQADMSPEAQRIRSGRQGAELEQLQLGNQKSRIDINANQMKTYLEQTAGVFNHIAQQASMGVPVENILGQIDQMVSKQSPERQQQWKQQRAQYAGMAPQQVAQQAKALAQHLLNSNPEHLSKMAVESMRLQQARVGASSSNKPTTYQLRIDAGRKAAAAAYPNKATEIMRGDHDAMIESIMNQTSTTTDPATFEQIKKKGGPFAGMFGSEKGMSGIDAALAKRGGGTQAPQTPFTPSKPTSNIILEEIRSLEDSYRSIPVTEHKRRKEVLEKIQRLKAITNQ